MLSKSNSKKSARRKVSEIYHLCWTNIEASITAMKDTERRSVHNLCFIDKKKKKEIGQFLLLIAGAVLFNHL